MANRKIRRCPLCKGTTGFEIMVWLSGYQEKKITFKGKVISENRCGVDNVEHYAICLDCGKSFSADNLDLKNV